MTASTLALVGTAAAIPAAVVLLLASVRSGAAAENPRVPLPMAAKSDGE